MRIRMSMLGQMKERRAEIRGSDLQNLKAFRRLHQYRQGVLVVTADQTIGQSTNTSLGFVR
jgi:hypothetical protein